MTSDDRGPCSAVTRLNCQRQQGVIMSPVMKSFLAGAMSGTMSTLLFQPLDLVKTRLQSPVYIGSNTGMVDLAVNVVRKEKFPALWNGLWPSLTRNAPGVGLYFGTLHYLRNTFGSSKPSAVEALTLGMSARSIVAIMMLPITVIKTRYESGNFQYSGMVDALIKTYKADGWRGLYSGLSATLVRDAPFSGIYFMFYTRLKIYNQPSLSGHGLENAVDFCNGVVAGMLASFITQPADVIKTNMQLYPQRHRQLKQVVLYIYQERGLFGFWRGIIPRTLRRTMIAALAWTLFEEISRRCNLK